MQENKLFDIKPIGKINSYEDYYLTERRGDWIPNKLIDKNVFEFNNYGKITSKESINQNNNQINSTLKFEYLNGLLIREINNSKYGESVTICRYNKVGHLINKSIENSSGDNIIYDYNYDESNRLIKSIVEFSTRTDIYEYDFQKVDKTIIKTTKINGTVNSIDHFINKLIVKTINSQNEITEFSYDSKQRLLKEKREEFIREFKYSENGFPSEYIGFYNKTDFNKEFYEIEIDNEKNWTEIKVFTETENFTKHLKSIRKRKINYT